MNMEYCLLGFCVFFFVGVDNGQILELGNGDSCTTLSIYYTKNH